MAGYNSNDPDSQQVAYDNALAYYRAVEPVFTEERLRVVGGVLEVVEVSGPAVGGGIFPCKTKVKARYRLEEIK